MTYRVVFVDDYIDGGFDELLHEEGVLDAVPVELAELAELATDIFGEETHAIALDYQLDENLGKLKPEQGFKASSLAQKLRDQAVERPEHDAPIVLFSALNKVLTLFAPDKTAHDLFDRVYTKNEINSDVERVKSEILDLCSAYEALRPQSGAFDLYSIMNADERDVEALDIQALRIELKDAKAPHIAARVILKDVVLQSGLLLDQADVFARLGVSLDNDTAILSKLNEADLAYRGLFSTAWPRWWAHRLDEWMKDLFAARATGLTAADRTKLLNERFGLNLAPAKSPWTGTDDALIAVSCASCKRGTEQRHSVALFVPTLPKYLNRPRICWDCIATDKVENSEGKMVFDDNDLDLVAEIKLMKRP